MSFAIYLIFLVLVFLRPVEIFIPDLAAIYRPMMVLSLVTLLTAAVAALRAGVLTQHRQYIGVLFGFVGAIIASNLAMNYFSGVLDSVVVFSFPLLVILSTICSVTSVNRLRAICIVLVLCSVAMSIEGIAAYHRGFMVDQLVLAQHGSEEDEATGAESNDIPADDTSGAVLWRVRNLGFLSDPNDLAQMLVVAIPMLIGLFVRGRWFFNAALLLPAFGSLLYTIYLTHSRGALFGLAAALSMMFYRTIGLVRTGLLLGMGAVLASALNFSGGRDISFGEESAAIRIDAWSSGLEMLRAHPLTGIGFGMFTDFHYATAHNSLVLCFAELGLIGYLFWLGLLVLAFRILSRAVSHSPPESDEARWARILRASLVGFLACAVFLSRTYQPTLFLLLGLCAPCYFLARLRGQAGGPQSLGPPEAIPWWRVTFALEFLTIMAIYVIVRTEG